MRVLLAHARDGRLDEVRPRQVVEAADDDVVGDRYARLDARAERICRHPAVGDEGHVGGVRDLEHAGGRSVASVLAGAGVPAEIW